jgi:hypothetical protein
MITDYWAIIHLYHKEAQETVTMKPI